MIPGLSRFPEPHDTIEGVGHRIRLGGSTCESVVQRCLDRIDEWDWQVRAWVHVDHEGAIRRARDLDRELADGDDRGPLHGIPIGVKDIIDVEGLPTASGRTGRIGTVAESDAAIVSTLRDAGAIMLGKTVNTAIAWIDPPPTRNPWNTARTPGGSSSGSAAAVACGMCLGALGTQTGGSITRPAAFCGVASIKPSFGKLDTDGILPLAPSLDTPGALARTVVDLWMLWRGMGGGGDERPGIGLPRTARSSPPHFNRLGGFFDQHSDPAMVEATERVIDVLGDAGAVIVTRDDADRIPEVLRHHRVIMAAEASAEHRARRDEHPDEYPHHISALIDEGSAILATEYLESKRQQRELGRWQHGLMAWPSGHFHADAMILPAAPGPAPDRASTGSPIFNSPWTFSGQPSISIPIGLGPEGLPLAIQLVGHPGRESCLFNIALWCESKIRKGRA